MVAFTLPQNSKVQHGKVHAMPAGTNIRSFKIYRWNPDEGNNPQVDTYHVHMDECGPVVLGALLQIKNEQDASLTFRRRCRTGL